MTAYSFPSVLKDGITLIVGLGETGVAAARWCAKQGAQLRIADTRSAPSGLQALNDGIDTSNFDFRLGADALSDTVLDGVHTLVLSPGLAPGVEPVRSLLSAAAHRDIDVLGEVELFARALGDLGEQGYTPKVLAVTGTNGKTTVTAMARQFAQASGYSAVAAGNISPAALAALDVALDTDSLPDVWVIELSSFQLVTTRSLKATAAVVLNISQDHIDWHGSLDAYVQAKAALLTQAQVRVINRDDAVVRAMVDDVRAPDVRSFGSDSPTFSGDMGIEDNQAIAWICAAQVADVNDVGVKARGSRKLTAHVEAERAAGSVQRLMPADALRVRGRHNALNAQAAMILVRTLGAGWAAMLHALRDYGGEPHRMEVVRSVAGVEFINDSKGTNVGATVAALDGMQRPVVLIAGGLAKGQDFTALAQAAKEHARTVVLLGQDAPEIAAALDATGVASTRVDTMAQAVEQAFRSAQAGEAVLLSPACASMDMFKNYQHRGQCFVEHVTELALDQGEVA